MVAIVVVLILSVQLAAAYWAVGRGGDGGGRLLADGYPLGGDFVLYYSASQVLATEGAGAVYDLARLHEAQTAILGAEAIGFWAWFYAPTVLLLVAPLRYLSFEAALIAWTALWLILLLWLAYRALPHRLTVIAALLFPAATDALFSGQNGILSFALLGGGLMVLDRRPLLAGILLGLLIYKPQLGLLLPVALIAGGHWRALAGAAGAVAAFHAAGLVLYGVDVWRAYFEAAPFVAAAFEEGTTRWANMPSVLIAARLLGAPVPAAWLLQGAAAAAGAVFVAWLWRPRAAPTEMKWAGLVAALPLAAPYAQFYDMAIVLLPILWLVRTWKSARPQAVELAALAFVWLVPVVAARLANTVGLQLWPLALAALLYAIARRVRRAGAIEWR